MVFADKSANAAGIFVDQRIAAMLTDVIEGFYAAVGLADHQDFLAAHGLHLPVAWIRQLRLTAQQQPDLGPHPLPLFVKELLGGVAIAFEPGPACLLLRIGVDVRGYGLFSHGDFAPIGICGSRRRAIT